MDTKFILTESEELLKYLGSSILGLASKEVTVRQNQNGPNEIKVKKLSVAYIFYQQYANFLMLLLMCGAAISIYLREWIDGWVIIGILIFNGILGTVQEYKAERLTEALSKHIPQTVLVRRDGKEFVISRKELVYGDVVLLTNGQLVPADLRVVKNFGIIVDESMLTGETIGVAKQAEKLKKQPKAITEMFNILFGGTVVLEGGCEAVVIAIGDVTEFGKIISFTHNTKKRSSFLQQVNGLSSFLFKTTLLITGLLFLVLVIFKPTFGLDHIFLFAIALAIAIVPEMLPLISTIALTRASLILVKKGVLIKRLTSLEDLGGVEILCTDKTGTITQNVLKITEIVSDNPDLCLKYALIASKKTSDKDFVLAGSFDAAIWKRANRGITNQINELEKIWEGSFDPHFRWQFMVVKEKKPTIVIKGAPESVIERCKLGKEQKQMLISQSSDFGKKGLRVLAVAKKIVDVKKEYREDEVNNLDYLGLLVFEDPIKESASQALKLAEGLGVKIKILTGDSPEVAYQIANKAGMKVKDYEVITGYQIAQTSPERRTEVISRSKIFARVNPQEKYEIIQVFNKKHSVMFLGEGINDAPAIKSADVGMVVQEASDIAKETADIILTKPDLNVIIESIYLGRQIMNNISKYILITLTGNFGSLYAIGLLSVVAPILPLLPTQVLLENILTDVPMVAVINNPIPPKEQRRPFRQNIREISFAATVLGFSTLIIQFIFYQMFKGLPLDLFRTIWLIELVLLEFALIISLRTTDWFWRGGKLASNTRLFFISIVLATLAMPFVPYLNSWFHLQPYNLMYLLPIFLLVMSGIVIVELVKKFLFREHNFTHNN